MPVPQLVRAILYAMFPHDDAMRRAVAHVFVSDDSMTMREVAREFGVVQSSLLRAVNRARATLNGFCEAEDILPEEVVEGFYEPSHA